ncbi:MAG: hypothetical protein LBM07_05175, partial [Culturomica sp.]|nr:hypothetical protein [Culturomica sp.]
KELHYVKDENGKDRKRKKKTLKNTWFLQRNYCDANVKNNSEYPQNNVRIFFRAYIQHAQNVQCRGVACNARNTRHHRRAYAIRPYNISGQRPEGGL